MNRNECLIRLVRGINADLADYSELKNLLGAQFEAALEHDAEKLEHASAAVTHLAETIEVRRCERIELVAALLDGDSQVPISRVSALFNGAARQMFESRWAELESLVRECKAENVRTGQLMTAQHEIMKRVLEVEADIYAPT